MENINLVWKTPPLKLVPPFPPTSWARSLTKSVIRNIPKGVNKRLSENSANEDLFNSAVPVYQEAFKNDGYDFQLNYEPQEENNNAENNDNRNFKGDSRVNTRLSEKSHFYILIFQQNIIFSQKLMFLPPEAKQYKYLTINATDPPTHDNRSSHSPHQILLLMTTSPVH